MSPDRRDQMTRGASRGRKSFVLLRGWFRPKELAPRVGITVDNIAIYSANLTETAQTIDMAYSYIPPADWAKTIIVLGIWYGQFAPEAQQWPSGRTDIDEQGLRYGLYRNDALGRLTPR
jgi:hypothetical protein